TPEAWEVILRLCAIFMGLGDRPTAEIDDLVFSQLAGTVLKRNARFPGIKLEEAMNKLTSSIGPERTIDLLIRTGPYGDGFGRREEGLTLAKVRESAHGIDLGPLEPHLREVINTPSGLIELAPEALVNDLPRLQARIEAEESGSMLLIGRRTLRTSNSFMHNLPSLVKGRDVCTLQISPADARRIGLSEGEKARVTSRVGAVVAPIEVTEDLMPGVVSLPHGWGHDATDSQLRVAREHPGVNMNALTDNHSYDKASGAAVLFGTPVTVEPATALSET